MTTGARVSDGTTNATFSNMGYPWAPTTQQLQVGPYRTKNWSGTDTPPAERSRRVAASPVGFRWKIVKVGPKGYVTTTKKRGRTIWAQKKIFVEKAIMSRSRGPRMKRLLWPQPYTATFVNRNYGAHYRTDNDKWRRVVGVSFNTVPTGVDPKEHYALIEKLRRYAYGSGWNPAVSAVEMPKALKMIFSSAKRIRMGLLAIVAGSWRGVVRNLLGGIEPGTSSKAYRAWISYRQGKIGLSSLWLELQYGWLPLMGDMDNAAQYIGWWVGQASTGGVPQTRLKARRSYERTYVDSMPTGYSLVYPATRVRYDMQYIISNLRCAQQGTAPTLIDLASALHEATPWSFVLDWVVPIGQYLQALRTSKDLQGTVVFTVKRTETCLSPYFKYDPAFFKYGGAVPGFSNREERVSVTRTVSNEIAPPTPVPDLSLDSVYSVWQRAVSSVALLAKFDIRREAQIKRAKIRID